jgi:hypothetical protein
MERASYYPSGTCDFEVSPRFVESFCNPDIKPLEHGRRLWMTIQKFSSSLTEDTLHSPYKGQSDDAVNGQT